jgi:hypothetical protein
MPAIVYPKKEWVKLKFEDMSKFKNLTNII